MRQNNSHKKAVLFSLLVIGIIFSASLIYADEFGNNAARKSVTGITLQEQTGTGEFLKENNDVTPVQGLPTFQVSLNDNCDAFFLIDSHQRDTALDDQGDKNYRAIFGIHLSL